MNRARKAVQGLKVLRHAFRRLSRDTGQFARESGSARGVEYVPYHLLTVTVQETPYLKQLYELGMSGAANGPAPSAPASHVAQRGFSPQSGNIIDLFGDEEG
jgi:hypothetical protein